MSRTLQFFLVLFFALPIAAIFFQAMQGGVEDWLHFTNNLLPLYLSDTLLLLIGVSVLTAVLGVTLAWGLYRSSSSHKRLLVWLLTVPVCFPSYLLAYLYTDILQVGGAIHLLVSDYFLVDPYRWPEVRSLWGAIVVFSLSLYPYVFLPTYATLQHTSPALWDAASLLGARSSTRFFKVTLPLVFPSLVSGTSLIAMEVLNDFGTTQYFALDTIATGVFRAWTGLGSLPTASQIALVGLGLALILTKLVFLSQIKRVAFEKPVPQQSSVNGKTSIWFLILTAAVIFFSCVVPFTALISKSSALFVTDHLDGLRNTVVLMCLGSFFAGAFGMISLYFARKNASNISLLRPLVQLGYAVPGTVVAVGVMVVTHTAFRPEQTWLWTALAVVSMCYAYAIRFSVVPFQIVEGALQKLPPNIHAASRTLGLSQFATWRNVSLPMIRKSVFVSLALLAVDISKDLSVAIVLRPFNFDTLPIQVYLAASDERLNDAAFPAIILVGLGFISLFLMLESFLHDTSRR